MIEKFDKYWIVVRGFMVVEIMFDPRYNKCMLEYHFSDIYGDVCDMEIDRIDKICRDLISKYENKFPNLGVMKNTASTLVQQKKLFRWI